MKFYYYKITNKANKKFYIGITTDYKKRERQHFYQLEANKHLNYKMQKDYNLYGKENFSFEIIDEMNTDEETGYAHEYELIQKYHATSSYNILEGGKINPVYCPQVVEKLKKTHQAKYDNILQYSFDGKKFTLINKFNGIREACRNTKADFRAVQNSIKTGQCHHNYYWVKENEKDEWLKRFLKRFTCCVAKINEQTREIEDSSLTIRNFAEKYNTTYNKIYQSLIQNNRCEKKYKFIRISSEDFAKLNKLSL
ncbi:MAG: GIY-YIG nuclease family protein [Spirochaetia bacterium]|nr:GIY-YIG nuclease family protein [Spirochaetia bacterium]